MYKLLIVDDEPMIREGLKTLIDWNKYGFTVVGDASNGKEAIEKHKALSPDLILIDIRMPIMDGLKAIEAIRNVDAACYFLILSGYSEFNYAKQAIAYGVSGYVLKPIDEDDLESYIERISQQLHQQASKQINAEQSTALLREEWLQRLVEGKLDQAESSKIDEQMGAIFKDKVQWYQMILLELYSKEHSLILNSKVKKRLAEYADTNGLGWVFTTEPYIGLLVKDCVRRGGAHDEVRQWIEIACGDRVHFTAATSEPVRKLIELQSDVEAMKAILRRRFMLQGQRIYSTAAADIALAGKERSSSKLSVEELAQKIYYMVDIGSKDGTVKALEEASEQLRILSKPEQQTKQSWAQLLTIILNKATASQPQLPLQEELSMVTQLYLAHHYDEMIEGITYRLLALAEKIGQTDQSSVMKRVTDFIDRHYSDALKLDTLADIFNYNSSYLGKMFKNHTGEHFNTYLDKVRIKRAVELLQQGLKVHQVSDRVGYANVDYFHSKFKKYKGVSPSAYKGAASKKISGANRTE